MDGRTGRHAAQRADGPRPLPQPDRTALRRAARHRAGLLGNGGRPPQHPQGGDRPETRLDHGGRPVRRDVTATDCPHTPGPRQPPPDRLRLGPPRAAARSAREGRARPRHRERPALQRDGHPEGHPQELRRRDDRAEGLHPGRRPARLPLGTLRVPRSQPGLLHLLLPLRRQGGAHPRGAHRRPQPVRRPHSGTLRRLLHDHLGALRAGLPHLQARGARLD